MDELELLKQDWQKEKGEFPHYSEQELFKMSKKDSVSIVKYLFLLGLIEIFLWTMFHYFYNLKYPFFRFSIFITFILSIVFFFNKIKNENNATKLMKHIFTLRYIMFGYMIFIVGTLVYESVIDFNKHTNDFIRGFIRGWNEGANYNQKYECSSTPLVVSSTVKYVFLFFNLIFFGIIFLIYKKTYGKVLRRLEKNYQELSKIETQETSE